MRRKAAVVGAVDDGNGQRSSGEMAGPDLHLAFSIGPSALFT